MKEVVCNAPYESVSTQHSVSQDSMNLVGHANVLKGKHTLSANQRFASCEILALLFPSLESFL